MSKTKSDNNEYAGRDTAAVKNLEETKEGFKLPTLDQFMDIVSGEHQKPLTVASGYNVYNKYNKSS